MLSIIGNWRRERATVNQLSRLTDRELADLGIRRQEIKSVARYASAVSHDGGLADDGAAVLGTSLRAEPASPVYRPLQLAA